MKYVSPEYEQTLQTLAEAIVTPERFSKASEVAGQLLLPIELES